MKRSIILLSLMGAALLSLGLLTSAVRAETAPLTEVHIEKIKTQCVEAQSNLNQLHLSDALMRVNRGQLYESISTKLMAPLNSRLALNRLDSIGFVSLTTTYDQQLTTFRTNYQQYEQAMVRLLAIDCTKQPADFYASVDDTRTKRQLTHESDLVLRKTIEAYGLEFDNFAKKFKTGGSSV